MIEFKQKLATINQILDMIDAIDLESFSEERAFADSVDEKLRDLYKEVKALGQEILWKEFMEKRPDGNKK